MKVAEIKRKDQKYPISFNFPVKIADYELSIQASAAHYCSPRETLKTMSEYYSVEMAIFNKDGMMQQPNRSHIFKKFHRWNEMMEKFDGSGVFGWIDVELVDEFISFLENHYGEIAEQKTK